MSLSNYFSDTYQQARDKFLAACATRRLAVRHYRNHAVKGAEGEALYTDIAVIGDPDAKRVLIISSGAHGVEGYCGSALQAYALDRGLSEPIAGDCVCYLVHGINPYGFSHYRRTNEDNVDLNRNFIDFTQPLPENPDYLNYREFVARFRRTAGPHSVTEAIAAYIDRHGESEYQKAVTTGQYIDETAIYFGGKQATWSNVTWRKFLARTIAHASHVIHIDIHTGLGPRGKQTLIYTTDPSKPAFTMACECYGKNSILVPGNELTPNVNGPLSASFNKYRDNMQVIGVAPEFGTVPLTEMLDTLIDENSAWYADSGNPADRKGIIDRMRHCFCPDDTDWAARVWAQFSECLKLSAGYLATCR